MNKITIVLLDLLSCSAFAGNEAQTQPAPGSPAPDFSLATGDGSQVSLKDNHGKWVVLYFLSQGFYQPLHG